jgi:tungstate transport system ATP-binding protein
MLRRSARQHLKFLCPLLADSKIEALLARADLDHRANTPARALSGGEQQKLALIGALATHPDILFLDEPTAHLDFEATKSIESMIREAHDDGTSILMTSHNRAQAERLAQHVLLLDKGTLVESAPASQFFSAPSHPLARHYLDHV